MGQAGQQAKILSEAQIKAALGHAAGTRHPERDRVMILLSVKAGMPHLGHGDGRRGRDRRGNRPA